MKKYIRMLVFSLILIILICLTSDILKIKPRTPVMKEFYQQRENEIQVVSLGSSHIMYSLSPMNMYENHGIIAYNLGTGDQLIESSYYILSEVYKSQKPEVVLLATSIFFITIPQKLPKIEL